MTIKGMNKLEISEYLSSQNKRRKPHRQEESDIQMRLAFWLTTQHPDVIFTSALGGIKTTIGQAVKLKRLGYRKGWPDLFFAEPRQGFHGLFVELKTETGLPSIDQIDLLDRFNRKGYKAVMCRGFDDAQKTIQEYLK